MAANTSHYVYVVGQQIVIFEGLLPEPWSVLGIFESLDDAKAEVNKHSPDPVVNFDPKVNRYWHTPFYVNETDASTRVFWDIEKIKYTPKKTS